MNTGEACPSCVKCKSSWSAGSDLSCHDSCNDYKQWKYTNLTVYLGGAIDKVPPDYALGWRGRATAFLTVNGINVLDPTRGKNLHDPHVSTTVYTPEFIVESDLKDIDMADILLVEIDRTDIPYHGTSMELVYAYQKKKKIFVWGSCNSYWVRYHATNMFVELDTALEYIIRR